MRITLILGADGASFAHGLAALLDPTDELVVVVPTVRDRWVTGLKACPDLDALLAPSGPSTFGVADELVSIGYSPAWQRPSDADVAGRLVRTELLAAGYSLTDATAAAAQRRDLPFRLLPASDDRAELHVVVGAESPRAVHVAEVLGDPHAHDVQDVVLVAETWAASAAVVEAIETSDVVVLGPAGRTLAIDPVLRTPGVLDAIGPERAVLVVEHADEAPAALVTASGLREPDPGRPQTVAADPAAVVAALRSVVA